MKKKNIFLILGAIAVGVGAAILMGIKKPTCIDDDPVIPAAGDGGDGNPNAGESVD